MFEKNEIGLLIDIRIREHLYKDSDGRWIQWIMRWIYNKTLSIDHSTTECTLCMITGQTQVFWISIEWILHSGRTCVRIRIRINTHTEYFGQWSVYPLKSPLIRADSIARNLDRYIIQHTVANCYVTIESSDMLTAESTHELAFRKQFVRVSHYRFVRSILILVRLHHNSKLKCNRVDAHFRNRTPI